MRPAARRRSPLLLSLLALLLAVLVAVSACSSSGGDDSERSSSGSESFDDSGVIPGDAPQMDDRSAAEMDALSEAEAYLADGVDGAAMNSVARDDLASTDRKIIAKGNVSLESEDVEQTAFDVQAIADQYGGEVTERETTTNDKGDVKTARLLLRIPVEDFVTAFGELENAADLQTSNTGQEDVTTKVIDTQVRIRAQRRSLARVEELLDRAQSISDIIRIEAQLSRRQADLESLERRLAYLDDQTSMSTISVNISLPPKEKKEKKAEPEESGFFAGLEDGWKALKSFGTDTATITGQVLPFAGVLLLIAAPLLLLVRRLRRRDGDAPSAAAPADA